MKIKYGHKISVQHIYSSFPTAVNDLYKLIAGVVKLFVERYQGYYIIILLASQLLKFYSLREQVYSLRLFCFIS